MRRSESCVSFEHLLDTKMNKSNKWVIMGDNIPWSSINKKYSVSFKCRKCGVKDLDRFALGCFAIQYIYKYSDEELIEELVRNPYYQYFIGLSSFQKKAPVSVYMLRSFRKKISLSMVMDIKQHMDIVRRTLL